MAAEIKDKNVAATVSAEDALDLFRTELKAYLRHLPTFLADGDEGKFAVIKGDQLCHTWDTYHDALQFGYDRFGEEKFMIHRVDSRDRERFSEIVSFEED